jgi:hypothetical protein
MASVAARSERASHTLRPIPNDSFEIRCDPSKGRGVFARRALAGGVLIEAAPVVVVPAAERKPLDRTTLHDYYFVWDDAGNAAVALGFVSLCNHTKRPNARVRPNPPQQTLDLLSIRSIAAGDEITIDYKCALWFDPRD